MTGALGDITSAAPTFAAQTVDRMAQMVAARSVAVDVFFRRDAEGIATLCARMAQRFARGGRLLALGASPSAISDVRHVTVEFVHPVIVGKRALPALGFTPIAGDLATQIALAAAPDDMVILVDAEDAAHAPLAQAAAAARDRRCLTIAFSALGADVTFHLPTDDAFIRQELGETLYHLLWELVHVFFEHGIAQPRDARTQPGQSAFLYPFLASAPADLAAVVADVSRSIITKANETRSLREATLARSGAVIANAAKVIRQRLDRGGTVLAFGNGGSATDAMDLVADLRVPPARTQLQSRRALDLTEDSAILTALTNDVGSDVAFARQIIAYGGANDIAIGFSTSGSSRNVVLALAEARQRGLATIAFTGYDGGRIAAERLADHVIVAPSEFVPRIQEAHASAYHILRTLVG